MVAVASRATLGCQLRSLRAAIDSHHIITSPTNPRTANTLVQIPATTSSNELQVMRNPPVNSPAHMRDAGPSIHSAAALQATNANNAPSSPARKTTPTNKDRRLCGTASPSPRSVLNASISPADIIATDKQENGGDYACCRSFECKSR